MRYIEFRKKMGLFDVFSLNDIRMLDLEFDRRRLHEWSRKGYIKLIARGHYIFSDKEIDDTLLDFIANRIYTPSYISLESVLSRAGFFPETVQQVTSVSTRKTRTISTGIATFTYRTVVPRLFFGYEIGGHGTKVACVEKAILDYLYLHPHLRTKQDYESLRIDRQELAGRIRQERLDDYLSRFGSKALGDRAQKFFRWVRYA